MASGLPAQQRSSNSLSISLNRGVSLDEGEASAATILANHHRLHAEPPKWLHRNGTFAPQPNIPGPPHEAHRLEVMQCKIIIPESQGAPTLHLGRHRSPCRTRTALD